MPELPEVETVRLQLLHKIKNKTITDVVVLQQKSVANNPAFASKLKQKTITDIDRTGKLLIISFHGENDLFLLAHLKMTGQFFFVGGDGAVIGGGHEVTAADYHLPHRHTRIVFHFSDQSTLFFNDMRLFGYVKIATAQEVAKVRAKFGPEPIADAFDCTWFANILKAKHRTIKALLLDQSFIAGLVNIYVDYALWRAHIRPTRKSDKITRQEAAALGAAARNVLRESIAVGGTTFQHFKDTGGKNGNFTDYLKVFGQHGKTCTRCGAIIKKIRCAGRGTHYCPSCQT